MTQKVSIENITVTLLVEGGVGKASNDRERCYNSSLLSCYVCFKKSSSNGLAYYIHLLQE
jgi:hypothetical protein